MGNIQGVPVVTVHSTKTEVQRSGFDPSSVKQAAQNRRGDWAVKHTKIGAHTIKMPEGGWNGSQAPLNERNSGTSGTSFVCRYCQRIFRKPYNLLIHERAHAERTKCHYDVFRVRSSLQVAN